MRQQRKRNGGMTVIELIVGFALAAIFAAALIAVIAPVYRTYQRTEEVADAQLIAGNVIDAIRTTAESASKLSAADENTVKAGAVSYFADAGGHLVYTVEGSEDTTPVKVFDDAFYGGKTILLHVSEPAGANNDIVDVTVEVTTKTGQVTAQSGVISTLRKYIENSADVVEPDTPEVTDDPGGDKPTPSGGTTSGRTERADANQFAAWFRIHWWRVSPDRDPISYFNAYYDDGYEPPALTATQKYNLLENSGVPESMRTALADKTLYLAVYFPKPTTTLGIANASIPVIYVTDTPFASFWSSSDDSSSKCGNMQFVYYNNNSWNESNNQKSWYARTAESTNLATSFDEKTDSGIKNVITNNFTQLSKLSPDFSAK